MMASIKSLSRFKSIEDVALVTHKNCLDGSGVKIMFLRAGGLKQNIYEVNAGEVGKFLHKHLQDLNDKFLIFADVGLNKDHDDHKELEKRGDCVLLDHHSTASHLTNESWCLIDQEKCGTELLRLYLELTDDYSYKLSRLIQDDDLWIKKNPESDDLSAFHVFVGSDNFVDRFRYTRNVYRESIFDIDEKEIVSMISDRKERIIEDLLNRVYYKKMCVGDNQINIGYIVSSDHNTSPLLNRLLDRRKDLDVACQINIEKGSVSFRSKNYDVSKLAQLFGGGGHKRASGHSIKEDLLERLIEDIHGI